jgi:CDP-paratose 2-epimerase
VDGCGAVVHLAAQVAVTTSLIDPITDFEVNARGTLNLLEALRGLSTPPPLLFTSTNKVYGHLTDVGLLQVDGRHVPHDPAVRERGIGESRSISFCSPYGCSKGAADQYVRDYARIYGMRTVALRQSCIYGQRQFGVEDQGWLAHFVIATQFNRPLSIYGDGFVLSHLSAAAAHGLPLPLGRLDTVHLLDRSPTGRRRRSQGVLWPGGGPRAYC